VSKGYNYLYHPVVLDPDGDIVTLSLKTSAPGMVFDSSTGNIQWQLNKSSEGSHHVVLVATDTDGAQSSQVYDLTINLNGGI
jgi:hypothetical protein